MLSQAHICDGTSARARDRELQVELGDTVLGLTVQNPLLAASNAHGHPNNNGSDDDKLSDYVPGSRDLSVSRAVCPNSGQNRASSAMHPDE